MNKVIHFEIPAKKMERARKFYEDVFGWQLREWQPSYVIATTVASDEQGNPLEVGGINGALMKYDTHNPTTVITVQVESIDEFLKKIEAAGGALVMPKEKVDEMGYMARVVDSEENVIGLWEDLKK